MRLELVPYGVPTWRGGRRSLIPLFVRAEFLESLLSTEPFPTKFGHVRQEWSDLRPPPTCWVKENLIKLSKEKGVLSLSTTS